MFRSPSKSARLRAKSERQGGDGSTADSDSDEEEELIEEELTYISPIETVDAYTTFKRALTSTFTVFVSFWGGSD